MAQLYQVQEIPATGRSTLIPSWRFHTSWAEGEYGFQFPNHRAQLERFRWFLEKHAATDPLNVAKASQVRKELEYYKKVLSKTLLETAGSLEAGFVDVYDHADSSSFHSIPWELLESPVSSHNTPIIVRRRVSHARSSKTSTAHTPETFNVLLVAARREDDDKDYRQAALPILRLIQDLPDGAPLVTVEIVRPGTFKALKERLTDSGRRQNGFTYHLVHLDLHGGLNKEGRAELFFSDRAVPASKVSQVLTSHGVQYAIVNACESARGDSGLQGNLAKTFVLDGMACVLAMSYQLNVSAVSFLTHHFYDAFFYRNLSFTRAAHAARQAMREHPARQGRFGLLVDLEDWIVPVIYSSGDSDRPVVATKNVSRIQQKLPNLFRRVDGSPNPMPADLIGRDADILQLEDRLLKNSQTGKGRLIFLDGPNGVGKTSLLQHIRWWWVSTGMVTRPLYVDLEKLRGKSPEVVCHYVIQQFGDSRPVKCGDGMDRLQLLLAGMVEKSRDHANSLYPRPLLVFDHLWSTDWPAGKRSDVMKKADYGLWKPFFQILSKSSAFTIVASHRWPWYLDDHESSEFPRETVYFLDPIAFNRVDITLKTGGRQTLAELIRSQRDVDQLDLVLEWCGQDLGLLNIILPLVEDVGAVKAAEILTLGEDILELPQFHSRALRRLPMYKVAEKLWRKVPKSFKELLIGFAPFHGTLPRCYESYCKDFAINKRALLHPVWTWLAQFNPPVAKVWDQRLLSMDVLLVSSCLNLLPILKSMGLIRAGHMMGPTVMNGGLLLDNGGKPEGSMLHYIHPVFSLFLRHKARRIGFLPTQRGMQSQKSICLEKTFVDYHEKRVLEWFKNPSTSGMMSLWDLDSEMKLCKTSFAAAMEMHLRSPLKRFEISSPTPSYLCWSWISDAGGGGSGVTSKEHLVNGAERALSRCRKEMSNPENVGIQMDIAIQAAQLSLWLALHHLLVSGHYDKFVLYASMTDDILNTHHFRHTPQNIMDILCPERAQMIAQLDSLKRIRDARESNEYTELTTLANLPFQSADKPLGGESASKGWNIMHKAVMSTENYLRLQTRRAALGFWDVEEYYQSLDALYKEVDDFLIELAPLWPELLSALDSEMLCRVRILGFDEKDDEIVVPDRFWDEVAVDVSSTLPPIPNYASTFMAAIRNGTPPKKARSGFQNGWDLWVQSHARSCVLLWFQLSLELDDEQFNIKASLDQVQTNIVSCLGDWELVLEHQQCLAVMERASPLQELSGPQLRRLVSWHITTAFCAFHLSSWDLCLDNITTVFDVASQRRDIDSGQHFSTFLVFALLQVAAPLVQPYPMSVASALYRALLLGYGGRGIYVRNGTLLSLLLVVGEPGYPAGRAHPSEYSTGHSIAGVSTEVHAHLEFILSLKQASKSDLKSNLECFDKHAGTIRDLQRTQTSFPHSSKFCRGLLQQLKARPAERRAAMSEAENHLFQHSPECGCPFEEPANQADACVKGCDELLSVVPSFNLRSALVSLVKTPRMISIACLAQLWFMNRFRPEYAAFPFTEETSADVLRYLGQWHEAARGN